jgi:hypothetical protein
LGDAGGLREAFDGRRLGHHGKLLHRRVLGQLTFENCRVNSYFRLLLGDPKGSKDSQQQNRD